MILLNSQHTASASLVAVSLAGGVCYLPVYSDVVNSVTVKKQGAYSGIRSSGIWPLSNADKDETINFILMLGLNSPGYIEQMLMSNEVKILQDGGLIDVDLTGAITTFQKSVSRYIELKATLKSIPYNRLLINGIEVELTGDEGLSINKQANNITDISTRDTDYSVDFKLSLTRKNRAILDFATMPLPNASRTAHQVAKAEYYENGILMLKGSLTFGGINPEYVTAVLYAETIDIVKALGEYTLNDLDLSDLDHVLNDTAFGKTTGAIWALFEPSDKADALANSAASLTDFRPFVKNSTILEAIVAKAGLSVGSGFSSLSSSKGFTACSSLSLEKSFYTSEVAFNKPIVFGAGDTGKVFHLGDSTVLTDPAGQISLYHPDYLIRWVRFTRPGKYLFTFTGKFIMHSTEKFIVTVLTGGGGFDEVTNEIAYNTNNDVVQEFSVVWEWEATSENMGVNIIPGFRFFGVTSGSTFTVYDFSLKITMESSPIVYDDTIDIAASLPAVKLSDWLKNYLIEQGLVLQVNRGVASVWKYSDLYNNKPIAYDWSKYLDDANDDTVAPKIGDYAKANYIRYTYTDDVTDHSGDLNIASGNDTLEDSKELASITFNASNNMLYKSAPIVMLTTMEKTETGYNQKDLEGCRVANIYDFGQGFTYKKDGDTVIVSPGAHKTAVFGAMNSGMFVRSGLFGESYEGLSKMLSFPKMLTTKLNIPVEVAAGLNYSIPVFLSKYGCYFYVNKLSGVRYGALCTAELIKL